MWSRPEPAGPPMSLAMPCKTGTALKFIAGRYDRRRRVATFFAAFPLSDTPRYAVLVLIDEPRSNAGSRAHAAAESTAVPAAGQIIAHIAPLLDLN